MDSSELVLGVSINGTPRPSTIPLLNRHELVNDTVEDRPLQ
tara:strand:- start:229 stop:351 length:123 start_codon:yes stop_codon:yes gene_type:complete